MCRPLVLGTDASEKVETMCSEGDQESEMAAGQHGDEWGLFVEILERELLLQWMGTGGEGEGGGTGRGDT